MLPAGFADEVANTAAELSRLSVSIDKHMADLVASVERAEKTLNEIRAFNASWRGA